MKNLKVFYLVVLVQCSTQTWAGWKDIAAVGYFLLTNRTNQTALSRRPREVTFSEESSQLDQCLKSNPSVQYPWYQDSTILAEVAQSFKDRTVSVGDIEDRTRKLIVGNIYNTTNYLQQSYCLKENRATVSGMIAGMTDDISQALVDCQTIKPETTIFFSDLRPLGRCLRKSEHLSSVFYQELVPDLTRFFSLEQLSSKKVKKTCHLLILNALVRQRSLQEEQPDALSKAYKAAVRLTPNASKAVLTCAVTRENYRQEKRAQRRSDRRNQKN